MAVSFLKKLRDVVPKQSLRYMLHDHLSGPQPGRPLTTIHASALTKHDGMCPRYYALHDVQKIKPGSEYLSAADVVTYDIGNDLQQRVMHAFADMDAAVGHWQCLACRLTHTFRPRPKSCAKCGCESFRAEEVRFVSAVTGASCGVDLLVKGFGPKLRPIEIKTMGRDEFKGLMAPLAEHRLRTNLYLRIIAESDHEWAAQVATDAARILYACKAGYVADPELKSWGLTDLYSPFKEYVIHRKDADTEEVSRRSRAVKDFRDGNTGMPCGICTTALVKRAQYCSQRKACFSGDYPPEHDWSKGEK